MDVVDEVAGRAPKIRGPITATTLMCLAAPIRRASRRNPARGSTVCGMSGEVIASPVSGSNEPSQIVESASTSPARRGPAVLRHGDALVIFRAADPRGSAVRQGACLVARARPGACLRLGIPGVAPALDARDPRSFAAPPTPAPTSPNATAATASLRASGPRDDARGLLGGDVVPRRLTGGVAAASVGAGANVSASGGRLRRARLRARRERNRREPLGERIDVAGERLDDDSPSNSLLLGPFGERARWCPRRASARRRASSRAAGRTGFARRARSTPSSIDQGTFPVNGTVRDDTPRTDQPPSGAPARSCSGAMYCGVPR